VERSNTVIQSDTVERAKEGVEHPARKARADAQQGRGWYSWLARIGLVAKGISYGIVGVLALQLALGEGGKATSREGALATLADEPLGEVLLIVLAFGFAAYAIWRFVQAFAEREEEDDSTGKAKKWGKRAGYIGRGLIYAGLTWAVIKLITGSGGGESQNQQAKETTAMFLDWPGGRWIVGLAGLAIVGAGLWNVYRGFSKKFEDKWRTGQMSHAERTWGGRVARIGHFARGVVFVLIGVFVTKAAVEYEPQEAIGLDGALQKLASSDHGPYLLGLTAAGLICYGLYCLIDARYRDVSANAGT
jgi:Domain of Unknown Function (DUF1206)